jgi:hypothetical protein
VRADDNAYLHFTNALIDICLGRQSRNLVRGELEHANLALLRCYLRFDHVDLLLRCYSLALNFLHKLILLALAGTMMRLALQSLGRCGARFDRTMTDLLESFVRD